MLDEKKTHAKNAAVELPPGAQKVVFETIHKVRAPKEFIAKENAWKTDLLRTAQILSSALLICLTLFLSYTVYTQDKTYHHKKETFYKAPILDTHVVEKTNEALEKSLEEMQDALKRRTALNKIQAHLLSRKTSLGPMKNEEARSLLIRAGYLPSEIDATLIDRVKQKSHTLAKAASKEKVDQDVDFAKHVATDIVRDEVESFAHKIRLLTVIGGYLFNRVSDLEE